MPRQQNFNRDKKKLQKSKKTFVDAGGQKHVIHWNICERSNFGALTDTKLQQKIVNEMKRIKTVSTLQYAEDFIRTMGDKSKVYIVERVLDGKKQNCVHKQGAVCSCGFGKREFTKNYNYKFLFDTKLNDWRQSQFVHATEKVS
jgi:hypothetical protein